PLAGSQVSFVQPTPSSHLVSSGVLTQPVPGAPLAGSQGSVVHPWLSLQAASLGGWLTSPGLGSQGSGVQAKPASMFTPWHLCWTWQQARRQGRAQSEIHSLERMTISPGVAVEMGFVADRRGGNNPRCLLG